MIQPLRLRNCHEALLNQFLQFEPMHLVVRSKGLSFVRETNFGVFAREQEPRGQFVRDPKSGLSLSPVCLNAVYLFFPGPKRMPVFEFDFQGHGFGIAIQPRDTPRSRELLKRIASSFGDKAISSSDLVERGAGSWLDEWGWLERQDMSSTTEARISEVVTDGRLSVQVSNSAFRAGILLTPTFEDRDRTVRRIAAQGGCDAVGVEESVLAGARGECDDWNDDSLQADSACRART